MRRVRDDWTLPFSVGELAASSLDELLCLARDVRTAQTGKCITFSPKVFIPLTRLCRDFCGYCTFATAPARVSSPYLSPEEVCDIANRGAAVGCHEALFTLGESPETRYPQARSWLEENGFSSTVDYLVAVCELVREESGLLPHVNAGALSEGETKKLRAVASSQGMMLESLAERLHEAGGPHANCPDKLPATRLAALEAAGRLRVPFTTGILVGIGETFAERVSALQEIAASHLRHGHVQEVIVQNFLPKPGTKMHRASPLSADEYLRIIAVARLLLPPEIHLQAPPNLSEDFGVLLDAGIDDWGGVSPLTPDHVNPERPWPALDRLTQVTQARGLTLSPRLTVYPDYVRDAQTWIDPAVRFSVLDRSDASGFARDDFVNGDFWAAGGESPPPEGFLAAVGAGESVGITAVRMRDEATPMRVSSPLARSTNGKSASHFSGPVADVLQGVAAGEQVGEAEIVTLFSARGREIRAVCELANELREKTVGETVTWVANRNINYTNVCTFKCRFCAFSKGPLSLNLRGDPYLLTLADIQERAEEALEMGLTELCLQGGIHPDFDGDYYLSVVRAVKEVAPSLHLHGFTALEVFEGARRLGVSLRDYLLSLQEAGLATLPGTAAEILDDEVRAVICPDKLSTDEWLFVHETAHSIGLRSNITIMFGHVERPLHWARHMLRTRALAERTGGFTEFVPLPFVHMATPLYLQKKARRGPVFREVLLMQAVARIAYFGVIDNVQVSWVKLGVEGARLALQSGANDLGGTLVNENISRAAGASHGQIMGQEDFADLVRPLGRSLAQRTTLYEKVM